MRDWFQRWRWFCLLVAILFASAGPAGTVAVNAYGRWGESGVKVLVFSVVAALLGALLLLPILRDPARRSPGFLLGSLSLGLVYLFCFTRMARYPIEKIHFAAYGLLVYLGYSAIEKRGAGNPFLKAFCLVSFIGFLDEVYQGLLPNRRYDEQDILVNLTAVFLGLLLTMLLKRARPGRVFSGLRHTGNLPYLLLWIPAGGLYLFLHSVPLPSDTILGTWHRVGDCRVEEWLRLETDGSLLWWDEEGNRARGDYRITGNRLEGIYLRNRGLEAQNRSDCGWRPGLVMDLKIAVDAERLVFVQAPEKPWNRQREASGTGAHGAPASGLGSLHQDRTDPAPSPRAGGAPD